MSWLSLLHNAEFGQKDGFANGSCFFKRERALPQQGKENAITPACHSTPLFGLKHANVGEIAVALLIIKAVPHGELIGYLQPAEIDRHLDHPGRRLAE